MLPGYPEVGAPDQPGFHPWVAEWFAERLGPPHPPPGRGLACHPSGRRRAAGRADGIRQDLGGVFCRPSTSSTGEPWSPRCRHGPWWSTSRRSRHWAMTSKKTSAVPWPSWPTRPRKKAPHAPTSRSRSGPATPNPRSGPSWPSHRPTSWSPPPESLYILLTSERGRAALGAVETVIVDEIHALVRDKRGSHLALSLERLDALIEANGGRRPQRIALSATQRPLEKVAALVGGVRAPAHHHRRRIFARDGSDPGGPE
jgi:ATP-dependent Lhr-like helicase